jgi:tellurite resistance-related uncharacterized protein
MPKLTVTKVLDATAGPQLIEPGVWHRVEPLGDDLRCQLAFLRRAD